MLLNFTFRQQSLLQLYLVQLLFIKIFNQSYHFYAIVQIFIVGQLLSKFAHTDRMVENRIN